MTVTIEVPAAAPERIAEPDGTVAGAEAFAEQVYAAAGRYAELGDTARGLRRVVGWSGDAAESYSSAAGTTADEHERAGHTLTRVGRAVSAYASTLADLRRTHEDLVARKRALDRRREQLLTEIEQTQDATDAAITRLRTDADELRGDYRTLVADHDRWQREVRSNENRLRQSFEQATRLRDALSEDGGLTRTAQQAMDQPGAPGDGASPEQVREWWDGLSAAEREAVIAGFPSVIGAADGLPADARDEANRVLLAEDLATLGAKEEDGTLTEAEARKLENARATEQALADAAGYADPLTGQRPGGQLWLYEPGAAGGDGWVAVSVGDLDTADDVAVFTPGINTDMQDTARYTGAMQNLYESTRSNGDASSVATMFWLGYDAPDGPVDPATMTEGRAEDGGERLADAIDGLRASRPGDEAHLTAIGHSYGSTTTSYAASGDLPVDEVALVGSPGAGPAEEASDFSVGEDHTWVGRNSRDMVAVFGDEGAVGKFGLGLGTDPSSEGFGANRFEAEDADRGAIRNVGDAHGSYLDPDTESLYNLGRIVDGQGDDVVAAEQSYDPWYGPPVDPEWDREPTEDVPGRSDTT